jgi:hypothetical protein
VVVREAEGAEEALTSPGGITPRSSHGKPGVKKKRGLRRRGADRRNWGREGARWKLTVPLPMAGAAAPAAAHGIAAGGDKVARREAAVAAFGGRVERWWSGGRPPRGGIRRGGSHLRIGGGRRAIPISARSKGAGEGKEASAQRGEQKGKGQRGGAGGGRRSRGSNRGRGGWVTGAVRRPRERAGGAGQDSRGEEIEAERRTASPSGASGRQEGRS